MQKTSTLNPLSLSKSSRQTKSLTNFILLNRNRQPQPAHQWKPLQTTEKIMRMTDSVNREISFGLSYSNKKSILLTLNKQKSTEKKNQPVQSPQQSMGNFHQAEILLKAKLDFTSSQNTNLLKLKNNHTINTIKTFNLPSNQQNKKNYQKFNKFTNTTLEFNRKVDNQIEKVRINSFRLRQSNKFLTQRNKLTKNHQKQQVYLENTRMVGIITAKRYGLRIRLKHVVTNLCSCDRAFHQSMHNFQKNPKIKQLVNDMFQLPQQVEKVFYYFRLNKDPITSINDLPSYENVVLALSSPVFNVQNENYLGLCEEAQKLSRYVAQIQDEKNQQLKNQQIDQFNKTERTKKSFTYMSPKRRNKYSKNDTNEQNDTNDNDDETKYDWQLIPDVHAYIQKIVQNPQLARAQLTKSGFAFNPSEKNRILQLYKEKFDTETKIQTGQNFRNPLLQDHSHYHQELKDKQILSAISQRLNQYDFIKNTHEIKRQSIDQLEQMAKQQRLLEQLEKTHPNIINRNIQSVIKSKKSLIQQLDSKNPLLFQQNIPYMMNKYGISRYEIHNLFTIYKTLQKISIMKHAKINASKKILSKGIDRATFDEGMKRLDINPGDEVIKNICYFDDFISWEQFIKIVSIGLRKTPQEKLEAILSGIGGTSNGQLNRKQISIMIGNSLTKIFDSDQVELREYFTNVAMRDLDSDCSGFVEIEQIKRKCLAVANKKGESENVDLVTFLLLNS